MILRADRVDIGRIGGERQLGALAARGGDHGVEQFVDALPTLESVDRIERIEPIPRLFAIALPSTRSSLR